MTVFTDRELYIIMDLSLSNKLGLQVEEFIEHSELTEILAKINNEIKLRNASN